MFEGVSHSPPPPPPDQFHNFIANPSSSSPSPHLPLHLSFTSPPPSSSPSSAPNPIFPINFDPYNHHHHQVPTTPAALQQQPNFFHSLNLNPHKFNPPAASAAAAANTTRSTIVKNINEEKQLGGGSSAVILQQDPTWSNEEVLSLLRIRSGMELNWFPSSDFTWDHVSRKLSEVGFKRSGEKCREKFEEESRYLNTIKFKTHHHHNYPRTATFTTHDDLVNHLHNHHHDHANDVDDHNDGDATTHPLLYHNNNNLNPNKKTTHHQAKKEDQHVEEQELKDKIGDDCHHQMAAIASGDTDTGEDDDDDADDDGQHKQQDPIPMIQFQNPPSSSSNGNINNNVQQQEKEEEEDKKRGEEMMMKKRKRKREEEKLAMFKGFCQDIVDKMMAQQEEMQNKLIQDMVKRDQEKLAKEDAWKQLEIDRLNHDLNLRSHQQSLAGDRQSSIIKFLQNFPSTTTSTTVVTNTNNNNNITHPNPNPIPTSSSSSSAASQPNPKHTSSSELANPDFNSTQKDGNPAETAAQNSDMGKRWPRDEVLALINLRCGGGGGGSGNGGGGTTSSAGNKAAPLWERISRGMTELGYRRSAKRCKEKWENINKYFRKTKDLNKKRSLDSRTCPYFHQLSTLYGHPATEEAAAAPTKPENCPTRGD